MNKTVLLIEDEPDFQKLVKSILEKSGYEVLVAESGEDGLRMLREDKPLLVILDLNLPGVDGELGILPGHKPLLVAVGKGTLSYVRPQSSKDIVIQGGYAEILPDRVLVFTEVNKDGFDGQDQG